MDSEDAGVQYWALSDASGGRDCRIVWITSWTEEREKLAANLNDPGAMAGFLNSLHQAIKHDENISNKLQSNSHHGIKT